MYVRRAAHLLHGKGVLTVGPNRTAPRLGGAARDRFFERGQRQLARLAREIEAHTGCTLESRRALDFGCGVGRLALPLAERCEYVYGLDVSRPALRLADRDAKRRNLANVEWLEASRLAELSGRYDLVLSMLVFQHIPSREGERIFDTLVRGLRPGGVGAIQIALRPSRPMAGFARSRSKQRPAGSSPVNLVSGWNWSYPYMLVHSYSLNRLGELLAAAGAREWHVRWHPRDGAHEIVTIVFQKSDKAIERRSAGGQANGAVPAQPPPDPMAPGADA
ncbi:MAG: class I SAM-dependent methyltransferase [Solirubrobacteraceae bacterium]